MSGLILQFAYTYTDANRQKLNEYDTMESLRNYVNRQNIVDKFASYAEKNGLRRRNLMIKKSYPLLDRYIVSRIIYNMQNEQALTEYLNSDDPVIKEALKVFAAKMAFPKVYDKQKNSKRSNKTAQATIFPSATERYVAHRC